MIPQSMRPFLSLVAIILGCLVIANHWVEFVSDDSDLLTSHVLGFMCLLSGLNLMSESSGEVEEIQPRYQEESQTKF